MKFDLDSVRAVFPDAIERRGKIWLHDMTVDKILDGIALSFTRRRYPGTTFTWVEAFLHGQWLSLGDPWPCLMPPTKGLREEIQRRASN